MLDSKPADNGDDLDTRLARGQLLLSRGNLGEAEKAALELVQQHPESTSVFELLGDVYLAMGKSAQARKQYRKAMQLEPANVDAERKFAAALVSPSPEEQQRQMIRELASGAEGFQPSARRPLNAVLAALLFAGLGQLYNREYEKGLGIFAAAAVLLMLLFRGMVINPWAVVAERAGNQTLAFSDQAQQARQVLMEMSAGYWGLLICGIVAYVGIYVYGIYDAYVTAHRQAEKHRVLGV